MAIRFYHYLDCCITQLNYSIVIIYYSNITSKYYIFIIFASYCYLRKSDLYCNLSAIAKRESSISPFLPRGMGASVFLQRWNAGGRGYWARGGGRIFAPPFCVPLVHVCKREEMGHVPLYHSSSATNIRDVLWAVLGSCLTEAPDKIAFRKGKWPLVNFTLENTFCDKILCNYHLSILLF